MTQKIIFLKWLPGSGKSTWAKDYLILNTNTIIVNKDSIRNELHNWVYSKENEKIVLSIQMQRAIDALDNWMDVIVDNTHLFWTHEWYYQLLAIEYNCKFEIKSFVDVPLNECLTRNSKREWKERVPDDTIISMAKKAKLFSKLPVEITFDKVIQWFWENAFIFDIDGTLSFMNGRNPHDKTKVLTDWCYTDIVYMLDLLAKDNRIIICSWRGAECREDTETWLANNNVKYDELFMRPIWDRRNDSIIKYEILVNDIIPKYYVRWVFDDRDRVVKMWREVGLRVYQVNYWNF